MNPVLVLLRKDFALFFRDKASLSLTFVVPFALIYLFGQIYHVNSSDPGPAGIPVAVVNESDNPAAARLVEALQAEKAFKVLTKFVDSDKSTRPLVEGDLRPLMRADKFRFALVIPKDVIRTDQIGVHLKSYSNPRNEIEAQTVSGILQKALFSKVPELLGQSLHARASAYLGDARLGRFDSSIAAAVSEAFGGDEDGIRRRMEDGEFGFRRLGGDDSGAGSAAGVKDLFSRIVSIDNVQVAGGDVKSPIATLLVGGWAMQFLLFAVTGSATALFREKEHGIFHRVLSAPVTRSDILWSKFLYGICLGLLQLLILFLAGHLLFGIEIVAHLGLLVVVCVFAAAACTSFGMLIAAISPTQESARGLSTFVILLMCAVGGAWFPVSFMPEFIQRFSKLTLVYWSMEGFSQVLWSHDTLVELLPTLGYLSLITAIVMGVSVWRFAKGGIFD
ncbi:MAG TPA: ABC transporter permease [Opitutaceae bacterium]|nr:ABC transporter permease [Opitutaceae bacterium]